MFKIPDENPRLFHMGVPSPRDLLSLWCFHLHIVSTRKVSPRGTPIYSEGLCVCRGEGRERRTFVSVLDSTALGVKIM